jgi:hypothetical protein
MRVPRAGRLICAFSLSSVLGGDALAAQPPREASGRSAKAAITGLSAVREGPLLLVSFRLDRALDERTWEKIESGLPTGFIYDIQIRRIRRRWFDKAVGATRLQVVAMYNALTREYLVNFKRDGELYASRAVTSAEDLERALTTFEGLPSVELADEPPGRLVLRVRAEVRTRTRLGLIPDRVHTAWAQTTPFRSAQRRIGSGEAE